jgi:hypothetical protein
MRLTCVMLLGFLLACATAGSGRQFGPNRACANVAQRLQSLSLGGEVQVHECSASLLDVTILVPSLGDSGQLGGPTLDIAKRVWQASESRAAYVEVSVTEPGFGATVCYKAQTWDAVRDCRMPDTLAVDQRADMRVRVWDRSTERYLAVTYFVTYPDGGTHWPYQTDEAADGWSEALPLPPGKYSVSITDVPCGPTPFYLKRILRRDVRAEAGKPLDITIEVERRHLAMMKSFNNPEGRRCTGEVEQALRDSAA